MDKWEYKTINFDKLREEVSAEADIKFPLRELERYKPVGLEFYGKPKNPYTEEEIKIANQKVEWEKAEIHKRQEDKLNELGSQGWELFQEEWGNYTFKRKLPESV
tara:strand:+ start:1900 stop:2214 length:315 start_codon:yes stop_codon:yes gene_type:complete